MTTMWATLMIYEAMKNGQISEDAAKYFDGLIEKYSMETNEKLININYDQKTLYNTIIFSSIEGVLDNLFDNMGYKDDIIFAWIGYMSKITYNKNGENICLENLLGTHSNLVFNERNCYEVKTHIDNQVSVQNVQFNIKEIKKILNSFKDDTTRKAEIARLTELLEQGEKKLAELESSNEPKADN